MTKATSSFNLRTALSDNLKRLVAPYRSVSEVCRNIGVNRAQFNRYLTGESYPRPDMLDRICKFFGTDARILTEPLSAIKVPRPDLFTHPEIADFITVENARLSEEAFPAGFYRFSRQSFMFPGKYIAGLLYVYRKDGWTFVKGYEARQSVAEQGLPNTLAARQFRGYAIQAEDGIAAMISRRNGLTCTFNFVAPVASLNRNHWQGYAVRTVPETLDTTRAARMVYEYIGVETREILGTARESGLKDLADIPPFHQRLLRPGAAFA